MMHIGKDSGLDYDINVTVDSGLLTCEVCGRLPGYYKSDGEAIKAANLHLGKQHKMTFVDVTKDKQER